MFVLIGEGISFQHIFFNLNLKINTDSKCFLTKNGLITDWQSKLLACVCCLLGRQLVTNRLCISYFHNICTPWILLFRLVIKCSVMCKFFVFRKACNIKDWYKKLFEEIQHNMININWGFICLFCMVSRVCNPLSNAKDEEMIIYAISSHTFFILIVR